MKVKEGEYVISPVKRMHITKDKEYKIVEILGAIDSNVMFYIIDDAGYKIRCLLNGCAFIGNHNWIIKEQEYA